MLDKETIEILVCPVTHQSLRTGRRGDRLRESTARSRRERSKTNLAGPSNNRSPKDWCEKTARCCIPSAKEFPSCWPTKESRSINAT